MGYKERQEEEQKTKEQKQKADRAKENRDASKKLYAVVAVALIAWGLFDKSNENVQGFLYVGIAFGILALVYYAQDSGWIDKLPSNSLIRRMFGSKEVYEKEKQKKLEQKKK